MKNISIIVLIVSILTLVGCAKQEVTSTSSSQPAKERVIKPGYTLQFNENFKKGMNSVDDLGISVVIAVDVSGSMSDPTRTGSNEAKYIQATEAISNVVAYVKKLSATQKDLKINVAVLTFSSHVNLIYPLTTINSSTISSLEGVCVASNFEPTGGTAIGRVLERGCEILAGSGTILNSLIVITDGENSTGMLPEDVLTGIFNNNNNMCTDDVEIYTSSQLVDFIGFDVNSSAFSGFTKYGARVFSANDKVELEKSLKAVLEADITKLEGL